MTMVTVDTRALRTISEAAAQLSCSRATIYRLCRSGKLELVKFGNRHKRITAKSLSDLIDDMLEQGGGIKAPPTQPGDDNDEG